MSRAALLAAAALWLAAAAPAGAQTAGSAAAALGPGAVTVPPSLDTPPEGYTRTGAEVIAHRGPGAEDPRRPRRPARDLCAPLPEGRDGAAALAGLVLRPAPRGRRGDRPGDRRRPHGTRGRGLDRLSGRVDDGAGLPGRLRPAANEPLVWIGLSLLFVLPFLRRPLRLLHLDLAVLLAFSVSYALFNAAEIHASVPPAYPSAALPARSHAADRRRAGARPAPARPPLQLAVPYGFLAIAIVFLIGFRLGLNITRVERHRRRLLGRHRRRPTARRADPSTAPSRRQRLTATPTGRSTTTPTCPFDRARPVGRHVGRPAGRARGGRRLRPRRLGAVVPRRQAGCGGRARDRCSPTCGRLPVHAARLELERQRLARRRARPRLLLAIGRPAARGAAARRSRD